MDLLILAAITIFIFWKLNNQLGKVDEEEKERIQINIKKREEFFAAQRKFADQIKQQEEKIVGSKSTAQEEEKKSIETSILSNLDETTKQNFSSILQRSNLHADAFLNGAKSSFELVLKSFANADLSTLKLLTSPKIFQGFEAAISQRKSEEKLLITNLIAIDKAEITAATISQNTASVTIKFASRQINYVTNKGSAEILEGSKNQISEVIDTWTFKKDFSAATSNWLVSATS